MTHVDILVFLQNPWSRLHAGRRWDGASWEAALWRSRTGIRLRYLLPPAAVTVVRNCNPIATKYVTGLRRPDPVYIRRQLSEYSPRVLLLCGRQARVIVEMGFQIPFVTMPHPAWRLLTNRALDAIRDQLQSRIT